MVGNCNLPLHRCELEHSHTSANSSITSAKNTQILAACEWQRCTELLVLVLRSLVPTPRLLVVQSCYQYNMGGSNIASYSNAKKMGALSTTYLAKDSTNLAIAYCGA